MSDLPMYREEWLALAYTLANAGHGPEHYDGPQQREVRIVLVAECLRRAEQAPNAFTLLTTPNPFLPAPEPRRAPVTLRALDAEGQPTGPARIVGTVQRVAFRPHDEHDATRRPTRPRYDSGWLDFGTVPDTWQDLFFGGPAWLWDAWLARHQPAPWCPRVGTGWRIGILAVALRALGHTTEIPEPESRKLIRRWGKDWTHLSTHSPEAARDYPPVDPDAWQRRALDDIVRFNPWPHAGGIIMNAALLAGLQHDAPRTGPTRKKRR